MEVPLTRPDNFQEPGVTPLTRLLRLLVPFQISFQLTQRQSSLATSRGRRHNKPLLHLNQQQQNAFCQETQGPESITCQHFRRVQSIQ